MTDTPGKPTNASNLLVCDCAGSMPLDGRRLGEALNVGELPVCHQLCRRELAIFEDAARSTQHLTVACTQEAPLFAEVAGERDGASTTYVNIRERAGWSREAEKALPKIAALLADAGVETEPTRLMSITSGGQCLVYGRGQAALDAAAKLGRRLSVSVLLRDAGDALPPQVVDIPIHTGRIRRARGSLGRFELDIDSYAVMDPTARDALRFDTPRHGAATTCDLIFDMTGEAPLFADGGRRDGYVRVDPARPTAIAEGLFDISDLVGEFEKPLYVSYHPGICAHSRNTKIGCRNCLDVCPKGAIRSSGDIVEIDPGICGGCGNCSAVCPTGAASYAYPSRHDLLSRLSVIAAAFRGAGGTMPELLFHDESHGAGLISALARFGGGLPANVIPISLHAVGEIGHDILASSLAFGFQRIFLLCGSEHTDELDAVRSQCDLTTAFLEALAIGQPDERIHLIVEDDPDALEETLYGRPLGLAEIPHRIFAPRGTKRDIARLALSALRDAARKMNGAEAVQPDVIALPKGAPYGSLDIDATGCTLCLACVGACPAAALNADGDTPRLTFAEAACVQCGLCVATCPEKVIALAPRYNFAGGIEPLTIKEEQPFECIRCTKPFGTKSTIENIIAKLEGRHTMFQGAAQVDLIRMCDNCRVIAMSEAGDDPMRLGERPRVRTTDDYLAEPPNKDDDDT